MCGSVRPKNGSIRHSPMPTEVDAYISVKSPAASKNWNCLLRLYYTQGGMPLGTWFGSYVFLILIDDLNTIMATFKFVDDVTLTEIIDQSHMSQMQLAADQVAT